MAVKCIQCNECKIKAVYKTICTIFKVVLKGGGGGGGGGGLSNKGI